MSTAELLQHCFNHFLHLDHSNAATHCAPEVRYSPITFRLAEHLADISVAEDRHLSRDVALVMAHRGHYAEDAGR